MLMTDTYGIVPGITTARETYESAFQWGSEFQGIFGNALIDGNAIDVGNTPTIELRPGLLLGQNLTTGKDLPYSPTATNGSEVASAVLALFQEDRLRFGPVPEEVTVRRGLKAFSEKAGPLGRLAQWVLGADPGDELVLAVALAAWAGEKASRRLVVG